MTARPGYFDDGTPYGHIRVTDAPESYDGFGTRTIEWLPYASTFAGRPFRRVSIPESAWRGGWQEGRYASGLYSSLNVREWEKLREHIAVPVTA